MIVIGADTHKRTHALAAVDAGTGRPCADFGQGGAVDLRDGKALARLAEFAFDVIVTDLRLPGVDCIWSGKLGGTLL